MIARIAVLVVGAVAIGWGLVMSPVPWTAPLVLGAGLFVGALLFDDGEPPEVAP